MKKPKKRFLVTVNVPEGGDAHQAHRDVMQLMKEEVYDASNFFEDLEIICSQISKFLKCDYSITHHEDRIHAMFIFPDEKGNYKR
jgi:hypothetical protein